MIKLIGFIFDILAIVFLFLLIFSTDKPSVYKIGIPIWTIQLTLMVIRKIEG